MIKQALKTKSIYLSLILFILINFIVLFPPKAMAADLATQLSGKILIQVEAHGEAWYVNPADQRRYYMANGEEAYKIMRNLGIGVTNSDLAKIKTDKIFAKRSSGKILLQVEAHGEAYYIDFNGVAHYLKDGAAAYEIMRSLGLGITNKNLELIPLPVKIINGLKSEKKIVKTTQGDFAIDLLTVDLNQPNLEVLSLTAADYDCKDNCPAKSLKDYVAESKAVAAIHGAYFCPPDYTDCQNKINYYFYPFYNSLSKTLINEGEIKWLKGAILVLDENNNHYLFPNGPDFKSISNFESVNKTKVKMLVSNYPALVQSGQNIVAKAALDQKQLTAKASRGGIGFKGKTMYWFIAKAATVPDLAAIASSLGLDTALNLDGGGSSALYYQNSYLVGPGRLLPTAIAVREKVVY